MMALIFWVCVVSILYTYLGYPLLLWLFTRGKKAPPPSANAIPTVTLLIAAYNEETVIAQKLENSLALAYPREQLQILVAADGSSDQTAELARTFAAQGVELSYSPERRGKMAAINRAMPNTRGEIIVFSDANNMYAPNALEELVAPFADPQVGATTGAKVIASGDGVLGESEGLYWKYESFIKKAETRLSSCSGVAGEILALRRTLYTPPPDHIINDDFYIAMSVVKQGRRLVYVPSAISSERVSATAQDEMVRRARIVAGRYQAIALASQLLPWHNGWVVWQVVSHKFLRPLVPLAMIGALVANVVAVVWPSPALGLWGWLFLASPMGGVFLLLQLVFYGAAGLGNRLGKQGRLGKILYLPTFLVNSNLAALVGLYRFLSKRQTTLWQRARRSEG